MFYSVVSIHLSRMFVKWTAYLHSFWIGFVFSVARHVSLDWLSYVVPLLEWSHELLFESASYSSVYFSLLFDIIMIHWFPFFPSRSSIMALSHVFVFPLFLTFKASWNELVFSSYLKFYVFILLWRIMLWSSIFLWLTFLRTCLQYVDSLSLCLNRSSWELHTKKCIFSVFFSILLCVFLLCFCSSTYVFFFFVNIIWRLPSEMNSTKKLKFLPYLF